MFHANRLFTRIVCQFLACLMVTTPYGPAFAQRPRTPLIADPADPPVDSLPGLAYMLPQACLVVSAHPQKLLTCEQFAMAPIEVLQAASIQQTGLDPLQLESLIVSVEPPAAGPPNYSAVARFAESVAGKLHPQLTQHTQPGDHEGQPYFASRHPLFPSIYQPDDETLVATPEMTLKKLLARDSNAQLNPLAERLLQAQEDDLYMALDIVPLRPMINGLLMQADTPPELQFLLPAPDLISKVELRLNLSQESISELVVEANSPADAERLLDMVKHAMRLIEMEVADEIERLKQHPDPVQQAMGRYQERMMNHWMEFLMPAQEEEKLIVFRQSGKQGEMNALTMTATTGVLVALLLPAVQAAREAARRTQSMNNLKQLLLALLVYENKEGSFPAHASYDDEGSPLLSWRVHILPMLEQQNLYNQFHLDEPWDSEHNKNLISQMPEIFLDPSSGLTPEQGKTHYLGVQGDQYVFTGTPDGKTLLSIRDGTANTIMLVQVGDDQAKIWTKPEDWQPDAKKPLQGLTDNLHPGIFLAGFADGSVRAMSLDTDPQTLHALLTVAGGENVRP